jgi:hypothetical protein
VLENPSQHDGPLPRASLVSTILRPQGDLRIWMGGAHTALGVDVTPEVVGSAFVLDCAGDLPISLREAAMRFQPCVFLDVEGRPATLPRLLQIAESVLAECDRAGGPTDVISLCTHGMNRSGLLTGLVLRAIGYPGGDAVAMIRAARPGALSNQSFARLLME